MQYYAAAGDGLGPGLLLAEADGLLGPLLAAHECAALAQLTLLRIADRNSEGSFYTLEQETGRERTLELSS